MRYTVHALNGDTYYHDMAQDAGDTCCDLIGWGDPCAYYHDTQPGVAYPYVVYQRALTGWSGDAFATEAHARAFVEAIRAAHAYGHPLPVNRHTYDVRQLAILRDPMTITREAS